MPQTPTGQRQYEKASMGDYRGAPISHKEVDAIEAEAAAMERERLLAAVAEDDEASMCREELHTHGHGWCNGRAFVAILADPTP